MSAVVDFTAKAGVHHTEVRVPAGAPAWCIDRQTLWTSVELSERRGDATLALQYTLSLSREVLIATSIRSVERFVDEHLGSRNVHRRGAAAERVPAALAERALSKVGDVPAAAKWR